MDELSNYYSFGPYRPKVTHKDDFVIIDIDIPTIAEQQVDFNKVVSFCETGKYAEAKKILIPLIEKNPTISEYHRILGQILSDEGNQEEAINSLIDALKWNPKNGYALIMMGNIFARNKEDFETASKYYNQALAVNPTDYIAINNIGANLLQMGKTEEGIEYLEKGYSINPKYPNTSYGLSAAWEKLDYPLPAFDYAIKCMKASGNPNDNLYRLSYNSAATLAEELLKGDAGMRVINEFKSYLEKETGKKINIEENSSLPTAAKIEFAENHNRDFHLIKYKPEYPAVEHLIMHELCHLKFAVEAKQDHCNMLFISGKDKKVNFIKDNEKDFKKLNREGFSEESISSFVNSLYDGINRQIYNAPIDLFIEDYLFENYPELHPYQFISLHRLVKEGRDAVTNKKAIKLTPQKVFTASKILNLINAIQFKDLYGIDSIGKFNPLPSEIKEANRMWEEFLDYRKDRGPGEEYEIVKNWGQDLKMDGYFELVDEEDFRNNPKTVEQIFESMVDDPFSANTDKNFKDRETKKFLETQDKLGSNPAVMWFMVSALQYFDGMPKSKIKEIAIEIAMIGTQGINPAPEHTYKVTSIPGKEFSGYNLLAFYFVSWKLAIPDMVKDLNLPYEDEYNSALAIFNSKK